MKRVLWCVFSLLLWLESPTGFAPSPAALPLGVFSAGEGKSLPLSWDVKGGRAALRQGTLHLEVAPKERATAQTDGLPFEPLRLYHLALVCRRGPGTGLSVSVSYTTANGKPASRAMVFQLRGSPRPNSWPLAPFRQEYVQRFCLPPGARNTSLQIALTGHPEAGYNFVDLYGVTLTAGAEVPWGKNLGPNLLPSGDMEAGDATRLPLGFTTWVSTPEKMEIVREDPGGRGPHGGAHFLRILPGKNFILAAHDVPIEQGRAYLISFWSRGKADLGVGVHALENVNPYPLRVGDPQASHLRVDSSDWTRHEFLWFAESLYAATGQLFISINPQTELHLDDVAIQRIEP